MTSMTKRVNMKKGCVVKRQGHLENFDSRKVYGSAYFACATTGVPKKKCEETAAKVSAEVQRHVKGKHVVTSDQLFKITTKVLKKYNKDAAFMYHTHRDLS
jgi:transcriptional regulator NrdR family protein